MRIKKYQNWKLSNTTHSKLFNHHRQKSNDIFSISQLLQTPPKSLNIQHEHSSIFTDSQQLAHNSNLNRRVLRKKDIKINQYVKTFHNTQREQNIKNKIKQRIKEEFNHLHFISYDQNNSQQQLPNNQLSHNFQDKKFQTQQNTVYVRGNSVTFNPLNQKKRSKSSLIRTSLPNFNMKHKLSKFQRITASEKSPIFRQKFHSVQMKRKVSSSLATRQKTVSSFKRPSFIKEIEPWQIEDINPFFQYDHDMKQMSSIAK